MFAIVFVAALMQPEPSGSPSAQPSVTPSASDASPAAPAQTFPLRRMPVDALRVGAGDILIRNSGSTNVGGYEIVVHPDDSVDVSAGGAVSQKTLAAAQAEWLRAKIADGPLDQIDAGRCMKSASFGSRTTISKDGVSSPDLSCGAAAPQARELMRTIGVIVRQLGIDPGVARGRAHLL